MKVLCYLFILLINLTLVNRSKADIAPPNERPSSCAKNPDFKRKGKDVKTIEEIETVCKQNRKVNGEQFSSLGCTYLEDYDDCVPDDSTPKCAFFTRKGCTHCWGQINDQKTNTKIWKIQAVKQKDIGINVNFCVDQFKPV